MKFSLISFTFSFFLLSLLFVSYLLVTGSCTSALFMDRLFMFSIFVTFNSSGGIVYPGLAGREWTGLSSGNYIPS